MTHVFQTANRRRLDAWHWQAALIAIALVFSTTGCQKSTNGPADPYSPQTPNATDSVASWHFEAFGDGAPVVVFEADIGASGRDWLPVAKRVAKTTRVIVYDRLGIGRSGSMPEGPRHATQLAAELRQMLEDTDTRRPYVLVAHGYGSVIVRQFHAATPHNVAAAVFVNPLHSRILQDMPVVVSYLRAQLENRRRFEGGKAELAALTDSASAIASEGRHFGHRPLIVVTGTNAPDDWSHDSESRSPLKTRWQNSQENVAGLSSHSVHTYIQGGGYDLHVEGPDAIAQAVIHAVEEVRADDD